MWTIASNDTRALLPTWIACVLAASVAALAGDPLHQVSLAAFALGTILIGAQSIGHEHVHRTLGLVLTLPVSRRRLLLVKLAVVGALVLPLVAYARLLELFGEVPWLPWLAAGGALCLAPVLTILSRSPLAGALFAGSVPAVLLVVMMLAAGTMWRAPEVMERAVFTTTSWLTLPMLAAGAVIGWRRFMRLEAIEGAGRDIHVKWFARRRRRTEPGRPLWQLVKKELRLQQMPFAITVWYLVVAATTTLTGISEIVEASVAEAATAIYWLTLPVVIGSLGTAEERQLGTLAWQQLLPAPAWQQWTVKLVTMFGLSVVFGTGVPAAVFWPGEAPALGLAVVIAVVTTAASMYVSSLCATRVRAAVLSLAAIPTGFWLILTAARAFSPTPFGLGFWDGQEGAWLVLLSFVVAVLLRFAFVNHRVEPPAPARIWRQTLSIAALVGVGILAVERAPF